MKEFKNHSKKIVYWLTLGIILIIIYKALDNFNGVTESIGEFFEVISPIIIGFIIAYILYLPCKKLENLYKKVKIKFIQNKARTLSILTTYIVAIILIIVLLTFIAPVIVESTVELLKNMQNYANEIIRNYNNLPDDSIIKTRIVADAIETVKNIDIYKYINITNITEYAKGAIGFVNGIVNTFVAFIISVYVLSERNRICNFIKGAAKALISQRRYTHLSKYFNRANKIFLGFISSQLIDAVIVWILTTIAMSILGIKYAPLLGFIIGLFNIIPYVGAIIAVVISAIITFITGGFTQALWMVIIVTILQQIDANIINPKIVGNTLKISPLLVMIAITIGGAYWGMFGIFIAVPISALIKIIAEDYIEYKTIIKQEKNKKEEEVENTTKQKENLSK